MGRMDRVEGDVEEQRFVRRLFTDDPAGLLGDQVRRVSFIFARLVITVPVELVIALVGEIVDIAKPEAVLVIEAALGRPVGFLELAEVPLAADGRLVAGLAQCLRQSPFGQRQPPGRIGPDDGIDTGAGDIPSRHQRGTGW